MADEQQELVSVSQSSNTRQRELRKEHRHPVPAVYQQYIDLRVKVDEVFVPVILRNFSGSGILCEIPVPLEIGSYADCVISPSQFLSKEIAFTVRVKHCRQGTDSSLVGAAIETVADADWFNVFKEVHDFIMERQGIYLE